MADPIPKQNKTFEKAQKIIELLNDGVTKQEFLDSFKKIIEIVNRREKQLGDKADGAISTIQQLFNALSNGNTADFESAKADLLAKVGAALDDQQKGMNFIYDKARGLKNIKGDKGDKGDSIKGDPGSPDTPVQVRDKLETLVGAERLRATAIDGLLELIAEATKKGEPVNYVPGGGRGIFVYINGKKKGIISNINFVQGSNMTLVWSMVLGQPTLTFNATGGGSGGTITPTTPPESVDGNNQIFTVSAEPAWIVADGTTFFEGAGYTWNSGTGKITLDVPPSEFIRYILITGSAATVNTPPEAPDGNNQIFTVSADPKYVVADGETYFEGFGFTYATGKITMDIPPSTFIRYII